MTVTACPSAFLSIEQVYFRKEMRGFHSSKYLVFINIEFPANSKYLAFIHIFTAKTYNKAYLQTMFIYFFIHLTKLPVYVYDGTSNSRKNLNDLTKRILVETSL